MNEFATLKVITVKNPHFSTIAFLRSVEFHNPAPTNPNFGNDKREDKKKVTLGVEYFDGTKRQKKCKSLRPKENGTPSHRVSKKKKRSPRPEKRKFNQHPDNRLTSTTASQDSDQTREEGVVRSPMDTVSFQLSEGGK